jgi:hypothetical protein
MAVDAIDAQIQGLISRAQIDNQNKIGKEDESDHARKVAEKKIALKKENLKSSNLHRERFQKSNALENRMRQIMGGSAGPEAAESLQEWQNNQQLQQKLTDAQKNLFREAMAKNPAKATKSAQAMNRLTQQPGFQKAVNTAQQAGTLQQGMVENPGAERGAAQMLQSRFMQSPKSDAQAKNNFLRFGMKQMGKGQHESVKKAGDMLNTLSKNNIGKGAQRASVNMAQRTKGDGKAMSNVDSFVQNPNVSKMPVFARSKGTELLAKANGKGEVKEGFEKLAADPKFRSQTAQNKGRFFSTIGTGRPSEFRQLADKSLQALRNQGFPQRAGQVSKFLGKMAGQIAKGGAKSVDTEKLIKSSKMSALPSAPKLMSTEGLDEDEAARVRSQNRAKVIQYFNKLQRTYEKGEKKLNAAKYLEDVNALQNLREGDEIDISMLDANEQQFVQERKDSIKKTLDRVRTLQRHRSRELRTKRMPPAKRRARAAARRMQGRQPKYFNPNTGRLRGSQAFTQKSAGDQPRGLPSTPMRGQMQTAQRSAGRVAGGTGDISQQVASAVSQLGDGPMTPQKAGQVAQAIASQVAQQVAQQVTEQLLGAGAQTGPHEAQLGQQQETQASQAAMSGKVDGWGIQRTFDRDLGGTQRAATKPKADEAELDDGPSFEQVANEQYKGRVLIKDPSAIRELAALFPASWKELTKAEMALLKNLGWNQQMWDTKDTPAAKWPVAMMTAFVNLNPVQRESVRKLGMSAHDWDQKVQAFTMGKNA